MHKTNRVLADRVESPSRHTLQRLPTPVVAGVTIFPYIYWKGFDVFAIGTLLTSRPETPNAHGYEDVTCRSTEPPPIADFRKDEMARFVCTRQSGRTTVLV
jgi:hypothetical protein